MNHVTEAFFQYKGLSIGLFAGFASPNYMHSCKKWLLNFRKILQCFNTSVGCCLLISVMALCQMVKGISPNYCSAVVGFSKADLLYSYLLNCVCTELVKDQAKTISPLFSPSPKLAFVMYWLANPCVEQYQTSPFLGAVSPLFRFLCQRAPLIGEVNREDKKD